MADATGTIRIVYATEAEAAQAFGSVHPDDDGFSTTRLEGRVVVVDLRGTNARSLLRAADDFLACVSVAEDVMNAPPMERRNA
jgi:hypothetical protein